MLQLRRRFASLAERFALATQGLRIEEPAFWRASPRLVFVCTGNICRSPYAEVKARSLGLRAISCGIDTTAGKPADSEAIRTARLRGIDLSGHQTSRWQELQLISGDVLVAMQLRHARAIEARARAAGCHTVVFSSFLLPDFRVIDDPYGKPAAEFERVFDLIDAGLSNVAHRMTAREATRS